MDEPIAKDLRARIEELCEQLWKSVGLQTSVAKYNASGRGKRGAVLDFVDYPLNNRYWLLDEFAKVEKLASEDAKTRRLVELANWETPGPGSFYDAVGIQAKSPHVFRGDAEMFEPGDERRPEPTFWWWDNGASRARLSWQATMWPRLIAYEGLDPAATYVVRTTGYGQCLLKINGERVQPVVDRERRMGRVQGIRCPPARLLKDRKLLLTFETFPPTKITSTGASSRAWPRSGYSNGSHEQPLTALSATLPEGAGRLHSAKNARIRLHFCSSSLKTKDLRFGLRLALYIGVQKMDGAKRQGERGDRQ